MTHLLHTERSFKTTKYEEQLMASYFVPTTISLDLGASSLPQMRL